MIALMQDIYDQFLDKTLQNRNAAGVKMKKEQLLKIAGGRIWTGRQAKDNGLVDALGTLDDAIAEAKKLAKMEGEPELLILPEPSNFLDRFMESKTDSQLSGPAYRSCHWSTRCRHYADICELQKCSCAGKTKSYG